MKTYKNLSELPIQMNETGYKTLSPQILALELLEKMQDNDWYIAHCNQSKSTVDNIKDMLTILSDNRIVFNNPPYRRTSYKTRNLL